MHQFLHLLFCNIRCNAIQEKLHHKTETTWYLYAVCNPGMYVKHVSMIILLKKESVHLATLRKKKEKNETRIMSCDPSLGYYCTLIQKYSSQVHTHTPVLYQSWPEIYSTGQYIHPQIGSENNMKHSRYTRNIFKVDSCSFSNSNNLSG